MDVLFYIDDETPPERIRFDVAMPAMRQTEAADQLYEAIRAAESAGEFYWFRLGDTTILERLDLPGFDPYHWTGRVGYVEREIAHNFAMVIEAMGRLEASESKKRAKAERALKSARLLLEQDDIDPGGVIDRAYRALVWYAEAELDRMLYADEPTPEQAARVLSAVEGVMRPLAITSKQWVVMLEKGFTDIEKASRFSDDRDRKGLICRGRELLRQPRPTLEQIREAANCYFEVMAMGGITQIIAEGE